MTAQQQLIIDQPQAADLSHVDYHADYSSISRSMLSVLKESPRLYHELYVARTRKPSLPTEAMQRGTRFDLLLLNPRLYHARYAIAPANGPDGRPWDRRFKEHKAAWEAWSQENVGREPVTTQEHNELLLMVRGALRHEEIERVASADGKVQHRLDWRDTITGLPCKCLMDKVFIADDLVIDVKTTEDPSPEAFERAVSRYGYHRQQAWYSNGYRLNYGKTPRFLFCVVGSKPPYDAAVYELDDLAVGAGERENERLMECLVAIKQSGKWFPSWGEGVVTIGLPRWHNPFSNEVIE